LIKKIEIEKPNAQNQKPHTRSKPCTTETGRILAVPEPRLWREGFKGSSLNNGEDSVREPLATTTRLAQLQHIRIALLTLPGHHHGVFVQFF
jgi:hypothetical protein